MRVSRSSMIRRAGRGHGRGGVRRAGPGGGQDLADGAALGLCAHTGSMSRIGGVTWPGCRGSTPSSVTPTPRP